MSDRGPRRRNPRTRHDVADALDVVEFRRWCDGGDQTDALRSGLESEALSRIARTLGIGPRYHQATDLVITAHTLRKPSAFTGERGTLPEEFARFYGVRREPARLRVQYADTIRLLVGHLDDEVHEAAELIDEMARICPAALPREDAVGLAKDLADEWRAVLNVTVPEEEKRDA